MLILSTTAKGAAELNLLSPEALQAYKVEQVSSVRTPYIFIGLLLVALAMVIYFLRLPAIPQPRERSHTLGMLVEAIPELPRPSCTGPCRIVGGNAVDSYRSSHPARISRTPGALFSKPRARDLRDYSSFFIHDETV